MTLAGEGPLSDGVPRNFERDLDSRDMPSPPRHSRYCGKDISEDDTQRIRRSPRTVLDVNTKVQR